MRLFQTPLNTCLDSPFFCQPLSSRFALRGFRALDKSHARADFRLFLVSENKHEAVLRYYRCKYRAI